MSVIYPIIIPLSKQRLVILLSGAVLFVTAGVAFISTPATFNSYITMMQIIGYISSIFFGVCAFYIARKLFDNKPGIIIDSTGITDNSGSVSAGQILWSDIEDISVLEVNRQKFITLKVKNPQDYINRQRSAIKRKMMEINYNMCGTPITISAGSLKTTFDKLLELVQENYRKHSRAGR